MKMDFSSVLSAFSQTVKVKDRLEGRVSGVWQKGEFEERNISGIVLQLTLEQLQMLNQGEVSQGGIAITTDQTLYFADASSAEQQKQSYVEYKGYTFKVVGDGFMKGNTQHNIYNCIRYIE